MYTHVFIGGTFDRLHAGHEYILGKAFEIGESVTIGVTTNQFIAQYKPQKQITLFSERKAGIESWIGIYYPKTPHTIIGINDPYEPAASGDFDAIMITEQNKKTGEEINALRKERLLPLLKFIEVPLVSAVDGSPISSTRIREGVIDRQGILLAPESLKPQLREPLGKIIPNDQADTLWTGVTAPVITVGDATSLAALSHGVHPILVIIDHKEKREPTKIDTDTLIPDTYIKEWVLSGPGFIAKSALKLLNAWGEEPSPMVLIVDGEEDLLVLPAIQVAPLGAHLFYGQPDAGVVDVLITEETKAKATTLLNQFEKK